MDPTLNSKTENELKLPAIKELALPFMNLSRSANILLNLLLVPEIPEKNKKIEAEAYTKIIAGLEEIKNLGHFNIKITNPENTPDQTLTNPLIVIGQLHSDPKGNNPNLDFQYNVFKAIEILHKSGIDRLHIEGIPDLSVNIKNADVHSQKKELAEVFSLITKKNDLSDTEINIQKITSSEENFIKTLSISDKIHLPHILSKFFLDDSSLVLTGTENPETEKEFAAFYRNVGTYFVNAESVYNKLLEMEAPLEITTIRDEEGFMATIEIKDGRGITESIEYLNYKDFEKYFELIKVPLNSDPGSEKIIGSAGAREDYIAKNISGPGMIVIGQYHVENLEKYNTERSIISLSGKSWNREKYKDYIDKVDLFNSEIKVGLEKGISESEADSLVSRICEDDIDQVIKTSIYIGKLNSSSKKIIISKIVDSLDGVHTKNLNYITSLLSSNKEESLPFHNEIGEVLSNRITKAESTDEKIIILKSFKDLKLDLDPRVIAVTNDLLINEEPYVRSRALYFLAELNKPELEKRIPEIKSMIDFSEEGKTINAEKLKFDAIYALSQISNPKFSEEIAPFFLELNSMLINKIESINGSDDQSIARRSLYMSGISDMALAFAEKAANSSSKEELDKFTTSLLYSVKIETRGNISPDVKEKAKKTLDRLKLISQ